MYIKIHCIMKNITSHVINVVNDCIKFRNCILISYYNELYIYNNISKKTTKAL